VYQQIGAQLAESFRSLRFDVDTGAPVPGTGGLRYVTGLVSLPPGLSGYANFLVFTWLGFWGCVMLYRAFVTALPQSNPLADAAIGELRSYGVDTSHIVRSPGRMGIYFLETGASQRASKVVYDRAGSAFALAAADSFDWPRVLAGAGWFHVTGITPAVSEAAAALAIEAARTARGMGITVSCDLNFRKNLWKWGQPASAVMPEFSQSIINHPSLPRTTWCGPGRPDGSTMGVR